MGFYLRKHGTPESNVQHYALLAEYNANGKQPPGNDSPVSRSHQGETELLAPVRYSVHAGREAIEVSSRRGTTQAG